MDNLLATTAEFLFIPEASLSTIFLAVFVIVFGMGVFWERGCRAALKDLAENGEVKFAAVRSKVSPEFFVRKSLGKLSAAEAKLEELPNVFVSVGIVATFLGLGVAIQGAAELLQTDKLELARLTAVLGVIAFKFQTSVWGICCSLIFRRLVVERYFEYRQDVVDELYDRLYSSERDGLRALLERQNEFLSEHLQWQRAFEQARLSAQNDQHAALISALRGFEDSLRADNALAYERVDYLAANFNSFVESANKFAADTVTFSDRVAAFKVELTDFLREEFEAIRAVNENFSRLQTEHIEKIHAEHEANIFHTTQRLDELHQKFYLDARRFAEGTQLSLDKMLGKTIGAVHEEYAREAHEIRNTIAALNAALENIRGSVENINHEFSDEQKKFVDAWQIAFDKITDTMQNLSAAAELNDSVKNSAAAQIAALNKIFTALQTKTTETTSATAKTPATVEPASKVDTVKRLASSDFFGRVREILGDAVNAKK